MSHKDPGPPPDRLNEIGVLQRREIEARIVSPIVDALAEEFGRERVVEIVTETIVEIARGQGEAVADIMAGRDLTHFAGSMEAWTRGGALELDIVEQTPTRFRFNVTRCRYAEMYRSLGLEDLGAVLSCNRDATLVQGFNPDIEFRRSQTIMGGAPHCDFDYRLPAADEQLPPSGEAVARPDATDG